MTSSLRLILSVILFLSLIQSGHAKTSTENLIVKQSDILEFKKSTEIEEGDFFEDVQTNLEEYVFGNLLNRLKLLSYLQSFAFGIVQAKSKSDHP